MKFMKYYLINVLETVFDEEAGWTYDLCNLCNEPIISCDVSDFPKYWVTDYRERKEVGANEVDELIESFSVEHMLAEHEAESTLISMDSDNTDLIRSFIEEKAVTEVE